MKVKNSPRMWEIQDQSNFLRKYEIFSISASFSDDVEFRLIGNPLVLYWRIVSVKSSPQKEQKFPPFISLRFAL